MRSCAVLALFAMGCASKETFVYGADIHLQLQKLRADQEVEVATHERVDGKLNDPESETIHMDQDLAIAGEKIKVAKLAENCADDMETAPPPDKVCLLQVHRYTELMIRQHKHEGAERVGEALGNVALGVGVIGSVACGIACDRPASTISWLALGGLLVVSLMSCVHNGTCHD